MWKGAKIQSLTFNQKNGWVGVQEEAKPDLETTWCSSKIVLIINFLTIPIIDEYSNQGWWNEVGVRAVRSKTPEL